MEMTLQRLKSRQKLVEGAVPWNWDRAAEEPRPRKSARVREK